MLTEWFRVVCQFDNDCYELRPPRNTNCLCILKNTFFLSSAKPIAECKNRFPKCLVYASQTGYCKSNRKFMESQCPKACKFCSKLYSSCTRTSKFSGLLSVVFSHFRRGSRNKLDFLCSLPWTHYIWKRWNKFEHWWTSLRQTPKSCEKN